MPIRRLITKPAMALESFYNNYNLVVNRMKLDKCPKNRIVARKNVPKVANPRVVSPKTCSDPVGD